MDRTLLPRDENKNFVSGEWSKREFLERSEEQYEGDQEEEEDEIQFRDRRIRFVYTNFSCCYTITQGGLFMYLPA